MLSVKLHKKVPIRLPRPAFDAVEDWFGRERLMRVTLKRRLAWLPPLAFILIVAGVPWPATGGVPESGKPLAPMTLGLGIGFALLWVLWRTRPRPWLFLFDAALFATLAVSLALTLLRGWSWMAFAILLLQVSLALGGVRLFRKFRGVTPARVDAE